MNRILLSLTIFLFLSCKNKKEEASTNLDKTVTSTLKYATGFTVKKESTGITIIKITAPWPNATKGFSYALVPEEKMAALTLNKDSYDAIITTPVKKIIVTSTTHIPVLEALGVETSLVGFPNTNYISSMATRKRIANKQVKELGNNESLNTEIALELQPNVVIGFGIDNQNKAYKTLEDANIPVAYNGDWAEQTPLGKAEWIKFFAPFFHKETKADSIFNSIEKEYHKVKELAAKANTKHTVLSGAMFKDVWYLPGGKSWAAQYLNDANTNYLWKDDKETGSLSLSWENVLNIAQNADYWLSPSQYTTYEQMKESSPHYTQFKAFKNKNIYTFANTKGPTGGLLFYELAPSRPDIVLRDLISIFHPEVLPNYKPYFYKPLE
ncbi:iron complex transport system substrate-binding protein [Maribacter vaceletii]|uniref:Iron complex transport system substrate-binding protein n=1 Tax=Maribacter vaceletii TaxID=1206816 RepID=A0A495E967_9FLAO|nr:ABC transporter substrate-binding protein [Maribacter vaceletii]RKR13462.1 iron complex transport system substrate-binding protein [Maribacter vaceletii]